MHRGTVGIAVLSLWAVCCEPAPTPVAGPAAGDKPAWDRRLAPFAPYEIVVLNPTDPNDRAVIDEALRRASPPGATDRFIWLHTNPEEGKRGYGDIVREADDPRVRQQLKSCLRFDTTAQDTTQVQVLIVRLRVSDEGIVLQAGVEASTVSSVDATVCVMQNVVGWRFGAGAADQTFDVPLIIIPASHR